MRDATTPDLSLLTPGSDEYKKAIDDRDMAIAERRLTDRIVVGLIGNPAADLMRAMDTTMYPVADPPINNRCLAKPHPTTPPPRSLRDRKKLLNKKLPGKGKRS